MVRHGATDWNRDNKFQGQIDVPLNEEGRSQARSLARALSGQNFDHAVASDLSRALDTAHIIRGGLPVEADERWREFAFGHWEGLTWDEITAQWPEVAHGASAAVRYSPPQGETFESVRTRVGAALAQLQGSPYENVLIVTHAGPLHAALHELFGHHADMQEMLAVRFRPASITCVRIVDGVAELACLNEIAHLR